MIDIGGIYMKLWYEASNFTIQPHWVIPFAILGVIGLILVLASKKSFFKLLADSAMGM